MMRTTMSNCIQVKRITEKLKGTSIFEHGPFSSQEWLESFRNKILYPISFLFEEQGDPIGIISGLEIRSSIDLIRGLGLFKRLFFFTGPVLANYEKYPECIDVLNDAAKRMGYIKIVYKSWDFPCKTSRNPYPVPDLPRTEFIIDLKPAINEIEKKIKREQRRNIRKAIHNGLELFEETSTEKCNQLLKFIDETNQSRQKKGYQEFEKYYITFLCDDVMIKLIDNKCLRLFHVEQDGKPINSTAILTHGKRAFALLAGTTKQGYRTNASPFSFYQICLRLKEEGMKYLNLGGVPIDNSKSNLIRFKRTLGAKEYPSPSGSTDLLQNNFYKIGQELYNEYMHIQFQR
jgi:hypothetical protein